MKGSRTTSRQARRIHRWLVPIAAAPLLITAGTGSLYSLLLEQNIDAFWLLKLHTGQFGWLNLQPVYPILLGGSHHCCDCVWADDAAQASPYEKKGGGWG